MAKGKTVSKKGMLKSKKRGGAVKLTEGPLDSASHSEMSNSQLSKHINIMQNRMNDYHEKLSSEQKKYERKAVELKDNREEYEAERARKLEKIEQLKIVNKNNDAEDARTSLKIAKDAVESIWDRFMGFLITMGNFFNNLSEKIRGWFDSLLNNEGTRTAKGIILMLIAFLLVVGLIIAFIFFMWWLINPDADIFKGNQEKDNAEEGEEECTNATEINIGNFGMISRFNQMLGKTYDKIGSYRPEFPTIPNTPAFNILNPFGGIQDYANFGMRKFLNSDLVTAAQRNLGTLRPPVPILTSRSTLESGRSDNVIMIDAKLINNSEVLNDRSIIISKTAINIAKPDDITWKMPENDYRNQDFSKVPDSLKNMKDENDISLNDKKSIIIPWMKKNNNYRLSCSDAYFENNIDEKANILIDSQDGKTCTFNIESKAVSYTEPKDRYKYTQDLSTFL